MAFQKWLDGGGKITIRPDGMTAQRLCLVEFNTWEADLASVGVSIGASYPGLPEVRCRNIDLEPFGQTQAVGGRQYRRVTVDYSTGERAQQQEVGHLDERIEFSVDCLVRNGGNWEESKEEEIAAACRAAGQERSGQLGQALDAKAEKDKTVVREDDLAILPVALEVYTFTLTIANMEAYRDKIRKVSGCVNSDKWKSAKPETLRFEGASSEKFIDQQGNERWRVTIRIAYSGDDHTWNQKWNKDKEKWMPIKFKNEPKTLYRAVPFAGLDVAI